MSILRDAASTPISSSGTTTVSRTITTGASSTLLVAMVHDQDPAALGNVTGVTANGVAMTLQASIKQIYGGSNRCQYIYTLVGPSPNTSYTITATRISASYDFVMQVDAYSGTSLTNPIDATANGGTTSGVCSTTLTTTVDNCWSSSVGYGSAGSMSGNTNFVSLGTVSDEIFGDSNASLGAAGAKTVSFNQTGGASGILTVAIAPAKSVSFFKVFETQLDNL